MLWEFQSAPMLQEMFEKAANPRRVFVGAVQQLYTDADEACWRPGKSTAFLLDPPLHALTE